MRSKKLHVVGVAVAAATTLGLLAGCGTRAADNARPEGMHTMPDGQVMSDAQMPGMQMGAHDARPGHTRAQPSAVAAMICSTDTAGAVRRNFALTSRPTGSASWSPRTREYTCRYPLRHGVLTLSVRDIDQEAAGRAYFNALRRRLGASTLTGMENLGFPAFENDRGQVGFLKDGRTLLVDGGSVTPADLTAGSTRTEAAYGVAAAVIACWKG